MLLSVLLLVLLVSRTQANHVYGTMLTYYPKKPHADGSVSVMLRYKLSYASCPYGDGWSCYGNCGSVTDSFYSSQVDGISGEWCQREAIVTWRLPNNSPSQFVLSSSSWTNNVNGIVNWRAVAGVEMRNRSDIGKPNTSPQTTIIPLVRVPSNCQRNITLLSFDPDGDQVKCRYGNDSLSECSPCTPPSVLNLSSTCTLSFSPTSKNNVGSYVVQMMMEDFPNQNINLTETSGVQVVLTTSDAISKIPIQFVLNVDPAVPSCSEGLYLPRFLPPTPQNGAQINTIVNKVVEITIFAAATKSTITQLLFSGPYNMVKSTSGLGNFTLTWTPSALEKGQSHPICFVVQASITTSEYHSELRCVVVSVSIPPTPYQVFYLKMKITTTLSLENNKDIIEKMIKDELVRRKMLPTIKVHLLSTQSLQDTQTGPNSG